ncbi:hypothetical protein CPB83DRAFT_653772 [Crepidotus variabilis]|uniref:Uncharacterized protein n=1 Tax=Crepidotus variabilis TaxID=179855 RepID=A0A9P6E6Z5_9AGAR|nr:hypothetical protein CPB83DRAFT_653772 [Crepidotus variabilis]
MNCALLTRELLDQIFEAVAQVDAEASDPSYERRPRSTLPSLARTSRFFYSSAIRIIWRSIPSLEPLFLCLPEQALLRQPPPPWSLFFGFFALTKNLDPAIFSRLEDLNRLRYHASMVRQFGFRTKQSYPKLRLGFDIASDIYDRLLPLFSAEQPLFTALTSASLHLSRFSGSGAYARLVLGKDCSLKELYIDCDAKLYDNDSLWMQWTSIIASANLKNLRCFDTSPFFEGCQEDIRCFPLRSLSNLFKSHHLTQVDIRSLVFERIDLIQDLALQPHLRSLVINLGGFVQMPPFANNSKEIYFPSLHGITIILAKLDLACSFLQQSQPPNLSYLTIQRQGKDNQWVMVDLLEAAQTSLPLPIFRQLVISNGQECEDKGDNQGVKASTLISSAA